MSKSSTRINLYTRIRFSRVVTYLHSLLQHAFSRNSLSTMISHEYIYTLSINNTIIVPKSEFVSLVNLPHIWVITYRSRATTRPLWHMSTRIDIWHDTYVLIPFGLDTRIDHTYSGSFHRVYRLDSKQRISLLNNIALVTNPNSNKRSKHFAVKCAFVNDLIEKNQVDIHYCPTDLMLADILTKALAPDQHLRLTRLMGMRSLAKLRDLDTISRSQKDVNVHRV